MLIAFILLVIYIYQLGYRKIDILTKALIFWNIWSFLLVEILSVHNYLTFTGLLVGWGSLDIVLITLIYRKSVHKTRGGGYRQYPLSKLQRIGDLLWENKLSFIAAVIVVILALITVPYNSDSISYHLTRIAHWAQNKSVAHYAVNDVRQLASPILAEFINVQVYILSGKRDVLLNLLQAVSYMVNLVLIFAIAEKIGCEKKFASIAAFVFASMPIAFGEALNTQVDLFATIWLLIFTYYFLDIVECEVIAFKRKTLTSCMFMGISISFGYLSKPTVNVSMALLLVGLLVRCIIKRNSINELLKIFFCVIPIVVLLLMPELLRNYDTFSALTASETGAKQIIGTLRPNYVFINMIKNFVQNWSNVYIYGSNKWITEKVMALAYHMRVDINDPSISEGGREYIMNEPPAYGHDVAANPFVLILSTLFFVRCVIYLRKNKSIGHFYSIGAFGIFVIFCAIVRWESYVTRYMLPGLALLCPMIAYQIQNATKKSKIVSVKQGIVPIVYFMCILELVSLTQYHRILWKEEAYERPSGYFVNSRGVQGEYLEVLNWICESQITSLGIKLDGLNLEYPFWAMLVDKDIRIENVLIENSSAKHKDVAFVPECVVVGKQVENSSQIEKSIVVDDYSYNIVDEFPYNDYLYVYLLNERVE